MRTLSGLSIVGVLAGTIAFVTTLYAQPPSRPDEGRGRGPQTGDVTASVRRMMTFDANQDGQLTKDEITDSRLLALFERADANSDGILTKDELTADLQKESGKIAAGGPGGGRGFPGGGPGGPGRPSGPGGPGGPPPIGQVLPSSIQEMLRLTADQRKQVDDLQKEVDRKLAEILTEEQNRELVDMRNRGPGGPDFGPPPGGPGGPGGPGSRRGNGRPNRPPE